MYTVKKGVHLFGKLVTIKTGYQVIFCMGKQRKFVNFTDMIQK